MQYTKGSSVRKSDYLIDSVFLDRWSPRAMSGENFSDEELMILFEAARWAPSAFNEQPWKFIYAHKETPDWTRFFSLLDEWNQSWCKNAGVLVCLIASKKFAKTDKLNRNALSDAGAAWENLALQGSLKGYVVHGMAGYNVEKARGVLKVSDDYEIVHMFAIGKPGNKDDLPEKAKLAERPNSRKPVSEFVFEGEFKSNEKE